MRNDFCSNYLAHHGILGQKWGKKNGPPYPLDTEDHSATEKKAGYKKSIGGVRNEHLYDRKSNTVVGSNTRPSKQKAANKGSFHLTDNQKRLIKVGATVAATALVAYGGYRLVRSPKVRALIAKGIAGSKTKRMADIEKAIQNSGPEIVKKVGGNKSAVLDGVFKKKQNYTHTIDNTLKGINPNYNATSFHLLAEKDRAPLDIVNCVACSQTYELRARGYEGIAQLVDTRTMSYRDTMRTIYKDPDSNYSAFLLNSWDSASSKLMSQGAGARGNIAIPFVKGGGHNIVYDIDKTGKVWFIDAQSGGKFDNLGKLADYLVDEHGPNWQLAPKMVALRTDNLEYNDIKTIKKLIAG